MKKILLSAFAIFAMMACNNEEPVRLQEQSLITFEDSFVEAKTRAEDPSITTTSIDAFDVWGFINQPSGVIFNQERVTKSEEGWGYTNLQYWMPEKSYYFHAVAPVDDENIVVDTKEMKTDGLGTISFTNVDGTTDLIYASKHVPTGSDVINNAPAPVELKFMHLLSKIKFTFTNGFPKNTSLMVTDIKITNAPAKGSIAVNKERENFSWTLVQGETTELAFGDVNGGEAFASGEPKDCAFERLTIPADASRNYRITFTLELFYGDQSAGKNDKEVILEDQEFAIGKNYNIKATIDHKNFYDAALKPIEFTVVEVENWENVEFNGNIHDGESTNPEQPEQPAEPEVLATPVVTRAVEGNVVTLTWDAVEGAKAYSVQVNDGEVETVEDATYTFTGEYGVTYTFTIKALPENEETHKVSEAAEVTVKIDAAQTPSEPEQPTYTSVEDFIAAPVDDATFYYLKGTITHVANTNYGNFDLTDETGTIYVYGLYSEDGAISKYWAQSGAKLGDDIVIYAKRSEFNGQNQAGSARFIELLPGTLAFWTFSKDAVVFGSAAAEQDITVDAYNLKGDIECASDNTHFTATYADGVLTIAAAENATTDNISGNITVTAGDLKKVIAVTQTGVSVGGGTEVSVEKVMKDFAWANGATVKEAALDENVKVVFAQGKASNPPAYYSSGEAVRLYQNGATMTVSANGKTIKSMEITFAQSQYYMAPDCGEFSAEGEVRTWTGEATEVKFTTTGTDKTHRAYIAKIKVTYID